MKNVIYTRQYIQFNDLVFGEFDMVDADDASVGFKTWDTDYGFTHGAYSPNKTESALLESGEFSGTITLDMKKLPCEDRPFYIPFVKGQISKPGKLWAVENNTLLWAYAKITGYTPIKESRRNTIEIDVDFVLPEGLWHKADKLKTFLFPFDVCDFMDCYDFHEIQPCIEKDCCHCAEGESEPYCECCDCYEITKDMALCYHLDDMQSFYNRCGSGYRIVYDCNAADKFFGDYYGNEHLGQKFCAECGNLIAGQLYSDTDIPTTGVKITLHGQVKNPYIEINGNGNIIEGEYNGTLTINSDGSVFFNAFDCPACDPLDVGKWIVPEDMTYGWSVHQGNNRLVIEPGACCGTVCAYVEIDSITF